MVLTEEQMTEQADAAYLASLFGGLTDERVRLRVSDWARDHRYLPPELTTKPGNYDPDYTPYLIEIMDRLSANDPHRKVVVMKGAQVCFTTGVLENFIGYTIAHDPSGFLYISADAELTKLGMELKVDRMLHFSGLTHLLGSPDGKSKRSGNTAMRKEFPGGFLLAAGAQNPGKLRSTAVRKGALDECDGMPLLIGGIGSEEGSPIDLFEKRTDTYRASRKILYGSTPLVTQTSVIHPLFLLGDQRHYYIPCRRCGEFQVLEWHGVREDKSPYGFVFKLDKSGLLIEESVAYECQHCRELFYNYDKSWFLSPKNGAEWRPHATTQEPGLTSYHVPAFLSPVGMYDWTGIIQKWVKAWDVRADRPRDIVKLRAFYNLERGLPWEERGESPKFERVQLHRRAIYRQGEIPNKAAIIETGAPVILLTCAVDVHGDRLDVEVLGWCRNRQTYSIEWLHFGKERGDVDNLGPDGPWQELRELLEERTWRADDGRQYKIEITLIDCGHKADTVHQFCTSYSSGVYPIMGRELSIKGAQFREFNDFVSKFGNRGYNVTATIYKDRLAAWLEFNWGSQDELQPLGYPNYPNDYGDDFFRQYEAEEKVEVLERLSSRKLGYVWRQRGQRPNHAWDCRIYNMAAFDLIVLDVCARELGTEKIDYEAFAKYATPHKNRAKEWLPTRFSWIEGEEQTPRG